MTDVRVLVAFIFIKVPIVNRHIVVSFMPLRTTHIIVDSIFNMATQWRKIGRRGSSLCKKYFLCGNRFSRFIIYQMIFLLVMLLGDIRSQYLCCTPVGLTWQPIRPAAHAGRIRPLLVVLRPVPCRLQVILNIYF